MLGKPVIVVNVKCYEEATGENLNRIIDAINVSSREYGVSAAIAVQPADIFHAKMASRVPVLAQHVDPIIFGGHTGYVLPESVKFSGASGSLVNHAEHQIELWAIDNIIKRLRKLELSQIVCTNNDDASGAAAALDPDFVAFEPPELIGGDISVSTAQPDLVGRSVEKVKRISERTGVLCGAGIKNAKDVSKAIELGCDGVLLASGIVKARDVYKACDEIFRGV